LDGEICWFCDGTIGVREDVESSVLQGSASYDNSYFVQNYEGAITSGATILRNGTEFDMMDPGTDRNKCATSRGGIFAGTIITQRGVIQSMATNSRYRLTPSGIVRQDGSDIYHKPWGGTEVSIQNDMPVVKSISSADERVNSSAFLTWRDTTNRCSIVLDHKNQSGITFMFGYGDMRR
jgi:hypothetical protein